MTQEGQLMASLGYMRPWLKKKKQNKTKNTREHNNRINKNEPKGQDRKKGELGVKEILN